MLALCVQLSCATLDVNHGQCTLSCVPGVSQYIATWHSYHIVGFLRYINSVNFIDVGHSWSLILQKIIAQIIAHFGRPICENKIVKNENQPFTEFKYRKKLNSYMVCILNMGSSDHHQTCENATFKFVHHNTNVPVSFIFTVHNSANRSTFLYRWTLAMWLANCGYNHAMWDFIQQYYRHTAS